MPPTTVKRDGITISILRDTKHPLPLYIWKKDVPPPYRPRDLIHYVESRSNEDYSINIGFTPIDITFDPSCHFRVDILFANIRVWTENISSDQIRDAWHKNIFKSNCGRHRGYKFYFKPIVSTPRTAAELQRQLEDNTNQDTVSIRFFRLKIIGQKVDASAGLRSAVRDGDIEVEEFKIPVSDPEIRLSHFPGLRKQEPPLARSAKMTGKEFSYRAVDDDTNPYYCFDFKLRDSTLLREMQVLKDTVDDKFARAPKAYRVLKELEELKRVKKKRRHESKDGYVEEQEVLVYGDDECGITHEIKAPINIDANTQPAAPSTKSNESQGANGKSKRARKETSQPESSAQARIRLAGNSKKRHKGSTLNGGKVDSPLFLPDDTDDDDDGESAANSSAWHNRVRDMSSAQWVREARDRTEVVDLMGRNSQIRRLKEEDEDTGIEVIKEKGLGMNVDEPIVVTDDEEEGVEEEEVVVLSTEGNEGAAGAPFDVEGLDSGGDIMRFFRSMSG